MKLSFTDNGDLPVSRALYDELLELARSSHPNEACGILFGHDVRITAIRETRNVHPTPQSHFEIDPQTLIDAHRAARVGGPEIVGYFHSHPTGDAVPSEIDRAMAAGDGMVWAIVARGEVRFWLDNPNGFEALSYAVVEG